MLPPRGHCRTTVTPGPGSGAVAAVADGGSAAVIGSRGLDGTARAADGRPRAVRAPSFTAGPTNRYGRTTTDLKTKRNHCGQYNTTGPHLLLYLYYMITTVLYIYIYMN